MVAPHAASHSTSLGRGCIAVVASSNTLTEITVLGHSRTSSIYCRANPEGKEKYPEGKPRIISDNGPQFIARDFKEFIGISGMTHVRTSPYYPQWNGKSSAGKSLMTGYIRPGTPLSLNDAQSLGRVMSSTTTTSA